ncbi:MAG: glycosyltransferase family 2 protein, partial [Pseudoclavibacter sp.]
MTEQPSPLLTAVIPAYCVEEYLDDCLDSVLGQQVDLEVIVVVDASPDRTAAIARDIAARDARVRVIESAVRRGPGACRNLGLDAARGRYVAFPDSDDL